MAHSSFISGLFFSTCGHFDGMSSISFLLLSVDVIHHVSDKVGDISHWGFTVHLEGDGVEEVSTKFGVIDSVKSFLKFIVASKE